MQPGFRVNSSGPACITLTTSVSSFPAEPLWHVPAQARLSAMAGSSGSKHPSRQDAAGKDSPNRHSKVSLCLALPDPTLSHPGSEACSDWLPPGIFPGYMVDEG